jgi:PX domain
VEVAVDGMEPHRIDRRYSELRAIHDELLPALPGQLPAFPSKRFSPFNSFHTIDEAARNERSTALSDYYAALFANIAWMTSEKLHSVFELPQSHRERIVKLALG